MSRPAHACFRHVRVRRGPLAGDRSRAAAVVLVAVAGLCVTPTTAARAHPFGAPQMLAVEAADGGVVLDWSAADDDLTALAGALDLVPGAQTFVYDADGNLQSAPPPDVEQLASAASSPDLDDYLQDHVAVRANGAPCPVRADTSAFPSATHLVASCPSSPARVELEVTLLQDLHPAYRTVATASESGDRVVLTSAEPVGTLELATAPERGGGPPWWTSVIVTVVIAMAAVGTMAVRRRAVAGS